MRVRVYATFQTPWQQSQTPAHHRAGPHAALHRRQAADLQRRAHGARAGPPTRASQLPAASTRARPPGADHGRRTRPGQGLAIAARTHAHARPLLPQVGLPVPEEELSEFTPEQRASLSEYARLVALLKEVGAAGGSQKRSARKSGAAAGSQPGACQQCVGAGGQEVDEGLLACLLPRDSLQVVDTVDAREPWNTPNASELDALTFQTWYAAGGPSVGPGRPASPSVSSRCFSGVLAHRARARPHPRTCAHLSVQPSE
jgi:hypothetical protein